MFVYVCIHTYVRTYVRTCVRACVRACVRTYVHYNALYKKDTNRKDVGLSPMWTSDSEPVISHTLVETG